LLCQDDIFFHFEIDHIVAEKHGGPTVLNNLCLSCPECNGFKGSDLSSFDPETGLLAPLFHPRQQRWADHFVLNGAVIEPLTPEGRTTVFLLRLNDPERVTDRVLYLEAGNYPCRKAEI